MLYNIEGYEKEIRIITYHKLTCITRVKLYSTTIFYCEEFLPGRYMEFDLDSYECFQR